MMDDTNLSQEGEADRATRLKEALDAFQSAPEEHTISAMPVAVHYVAVIGRVEHSKRGEEHLFHITRATIGGHHFEEQWDELALNAYAIRDEFFKIKTPTAALDFLSKTGVFSPLSDTITWSEFLRWQRFAYFIQEHEMLASEMSKGVWSGECGEVLKALAGNYPSSFFDGAEIPRTRAEGDFDARLLRDHPEILSDIQEGNRRMERRRRDLWHWFRQPSCSIEWVPNSPEAAQKVFTTRIDPKSGKLVLDVQASPGARGGAMIEFLLPQKEQQPVIIIRATSTLQAIAAAIYADRVKGIEYRTCEVCSELFRIGAHKDKKYCDRARCKNTAHQRKVRKNRADKKAKEQAEIANRKLRKSKAKNS